MKNRLDTGLVGRARRVLVIGVPAVGLAVAMVGAVPAQQAFAQDSGGGSINIGASIAATVADAVSGIATDSEPSSVFGGLSLESNNLDFGEDEGTAISDASGGNYNVSDNPNRDDVDE
jgi:hypothetical protein